MNFIMIITLKLYASFRTGRFDMKNMEIPAGFTVCEICQQIELPANEIGIILCNHKHVKLEYELADGDTLALFPLLGGG